MILPPRLNIGDRIGIFAGSSPDGAKCPCRFERAVENLIHMGFQVDVGNAKATPLSYLSGSRKERADAINSLIRDPEVACIMSCVGGYNANGILDLIDYHALAASPKILLGYSDFSAVLMAVYARTGCITFHGPALLPQFGDMDGPHAFTVDNFMRVAGCASPAGVTPCSHLVIDEFLEWDVADRRPRYRRKHEGPLVIRDGYSNGKVICCNINVLLALHGTEYFPPLDGTILCVEESDDAGPDALEGKLVALVQKGIVEKINGLIFGKLSGETKFDADRTFQSVLRETLGGGSYPIAAEFDFGHADPQLTLPIGATATLNCANGQAELNILTRAVAE